MILSVELENYLNIAENGMACDVLWNRRRGFSIENNDDFLVEMTCRRASLGTSSVRGSLGGAAEPLDQANFIGLVLGFIEAKLCM